MFCSPYLPGGSTSSSLVGLSRSQKKAWDRGVGDPTWAWGMAPAGDDTTSERKSSESFRDLSEASGHNHEIVTWCVGSHVVLTSEGSWDLTIVSLRFLQYLWAPPVLGAVRPSWNPDRALVYS